MRIILTPNPTGSGHNMRLFAIAKQIKKQDPNAEILVFLGSLQHIFTDMFESIGCQVVDLNPNKVVDFSKRSHLEQNLDWHTMIDNYLSPTFFNGASILRNISLFSEYKPDLVVSDFNTNATVAAAHLRIPNVFVTERFNFTLTGVSNEQLEKGEFHVNTDDMDRARLALNHLFDWICDNTTLILTDKPYLEEMDAGGLIDKHFASQKARFVGPMIRELPPKEGQSDIRAELGLHDGPIVVATVSGTTMFAQNKRDLLSLYVRSFENLRTKIPNLQMVLIGRGEEFELPEGVLSVPYLSDWMPLLQQSNLLLAHPGWITVTEISALGVPTIFNIASYKEYHEVEAYERLTKMGYATHHGFDENELSAKMEKLLLDPTAVESLLSNYKKVAPDALGAVEAAKLILQAQPSTL